MRIAVLMGGYSSEREISLKTGKAILKALQENGYDAFSIDIKKESLVKDVTSEKYDLAFIALHGEYGEDGRIQALLDIIEKPYTGSGFVESAISMDKDLSKKFVEYEGFTIPKTYKNKAEVKLYPVVVKPSLEGSSVGLYICKNEEELDEALEKNKSKKILIEEFVKGEELTVGVLFGEALGVIKIIPKSGVYDFKAKYEKGQTDFEVPAKIDNVFYKEVMDMSEKIYQALNLSGAVRVDLILKESKLYFLEVNTIPGMTETSLLPKMAKLKDYDFNDLVKKIVENSLQNM